jgi:hypothetical protein
MKMEKRHTRAVAQPFLASLYPQGNTLTASEKLTQMQNAEGGLYLGIGQQCQIARPTQVSQWRPAPAPRTNRSPGPRFHADINSLNTWMLMPMQFQELICRFTSSFRCCFISSIVPLLNKNWKDNVKTTLKQCEVDDCH